VAEGSIRLDDRHWPLVLIVYEGAPSKAVFARYLAEMERCFARREKHGYLLDGREGAMLGAEERNTQGAWLKTHRDVLRTYSVGTGLVVRSAAVRFLISAIYLIQTPVSPTETFGSVDDAHAWLGKIFDQHGLRLPPRSELQL
jgi:hypothetical protein